MKLVVFGHSLSTLAADSLASHWRGLIDALCKLGHQVTFFEAAEVSRRCARDGYEPRCGELRLYDDFSDIRTYAAEILRSADAGLVTSSCPDARYAGELIRSSSVPVRAFYDTDCVGTARCLAEGESLPYISSEGLAGFDVCFSYAGGDVLDLLKQKLGALHAVPLYGCIDPEAIHPVDATTESRCDLLYTGLHATPDATLVRQLFVEAARLRPELSCAGVAEALPPDATELSNVRVIPSTPTWAARPSLYAEARLCLDLAAGGAHDTTYCPSQTLFELGACAAPVVTSFRPGITLLYEPAEELLVAQSAQEILQACELSDRELGALGRRMRERTLAQHTTQMRARQFVQSLSDARAGTREFEREDADRIRTV